MNTPTRRALGLAILVVLFATGNAFAGRGGFRGGGGGRGVGVGRVGGAGVRGGNFRGGNVGMRAPEFHPSPSFHSYANRGNVGNRTNIGNQINFGNRNEVYNRNSQFRNANVNVNRTNQFNNVNSFSGWRGPYAGYHSGWVHGYWNGHYYPGLWGGGYRGLGWGLGGWGMGMASGLAGYGLGSSLYNWGYANYLNPYYTAAPVMVQQPAAVQPPLYAYDYAQPINPDGPPPEQAASDAALQTFASAREAFQAGDYNQALALTDQALKILPNDTTLHEFRALALFALGRYDEQAAALYAVLSVGPGWDWTTLMSLYPGVDPYTQQLRALEDYTLKNPDSAAGHFDLAYQYLTQGHTDAAVGQLQRVAALQPTDQLSTQLLRQLAQTDANADAAPVAELPPSAPNPPQSANAATTPAVQGNLVGNWTASPSKDGRIALTIGPDGSFTWKVTGQGPTRQFNGESTYGNGILTLAQPQGTPLVGRVTWQDPDRFLFQVAGGPDDPGLTFSR